MVNRWRPGEQSFLPLHVAEPQRLSSVMPWRFIHLARPPAMQSRDLARWLLAWSPITCGWTRASHLENAAAYSLLLSHLKTLSRSLPHPCTLSILECLPPHRLAWQCRWEVGMGLRGTVADGPIKWLCILFYSGSYTVPITMVSEPRWAQICLNRPWEW